MTSRVSRQPTPDTELAWPATSPDRLTALQRWIRAGTATRRVRRAAGEQTGSNPGTAPQTDSTTRIRVMICEADVFADLPLRSVLELNTCDWLGWVIRTAVDGKTATRLVRRSGRQTDPG